jgi:hypothetical protein
MRNSFSVMFTVSFICMLVVYDILIFKMCKQAYYKNVVYSEKVYMFINYHIYFV